MAWSSFLPLPYLVPSPLSFPHPKSPTIDPADFQREKPETTPLKYPEKQPKDSLKNLNKPIQNLENRPRKITRGTHKKVLHK